MVKLKAGPARAVAAAGARALAAGVPAPQPAGLVSRLVANGVVAEVAPVFSVDPPQGRTPARASRRALAMEALSGGAFPLSAKRARGLTSLRIERGWNAAQVARDLMADPEVEYAYVPAVKYPAAAKSPAKSKRPVRRKRSKATGVDPLSARQWSHAAIHIHEARQRAGFRDAADVLVAVVDSGIDRQHPDLAAAIEHFVNFLAPAEDDRDYKGHGTHVAGIIAAVINNSIGIAGLCKARLAVLKALPRGGDWNAAAYYRALAHPIDLQAKVVNLSLGGSFDPGEEDVIRDLLDAGIVVVAAMGNEFEEGNATSYPAAYPGVIAVGATDEADRRASFSCTGPHIALMAPGERILSTVPTYPSELAATTSYDSWPGTSMATPHVVAAAALLLAKSPGLTPADVKSRLAKSADRVKWQQSRPNDEYGWGRLNVLRALG
ncbi:MAG TPA: S8 family serine peptidase [Thermoanaerobaculia bacterium]|nr:S8 family serine peptidase [Thermoanaerobaculia bacterium]